jgi:hypothetical protein
VAATGRTEGTRLQFEYRVAEDGASSLISSLEFDPRFQSVCDWSFAADGAVRCLPLRAGSAGNYFADPQCARPLVEEWTSGPSCPGQPELRPMVATRTTVEGQCLRRTHVFEIGAKSVPSTTYLDLGGGGCYPLPNTEAVPYYELGAEIPPARFAAASGPMTVACGHDRTSGTRLKARYSQADGGDRITQGFGLASVAPRWYDEAMGGECSFQNAEDGVMRCLPRVLGGDSFADPACSEPLIMADSCSPPDGPDAPRFAGEALFDQGGDLDVCVYNDVKVRVYALGAAVTPAEYYVRSSTDGACTAQPNIEVPPDVHPFTFYPRGAEVPPSAFVAASLHGP